MLQEDLLKAMEIIAEGLLKKQTFAKTIKGIIISEEVNEDGSYNIQYQDLKIKAFPRDTIVKYKKDEVVMINLPTGELSDKKYILGTTALRPDETPDYDEIINDAINSVVTTGKNYIEDSGLKTLNRNEKIQLSINPLFYKHYNQGQTDIRLRAKVTSNIDRLAIGENFGYGYRIKITYTDKSIEVFDFGYLNMAGNIFQLAGIVQDKIFKIPTSKIPESAIAELYLENAPAGSVVSFDEIRLELINEILSDIIADKRYDVTIMSEYGSVFAENENKTIPLICQISSFDGINVDPWGLSFDYYWYEISYDSQGNKIRPAEPTHTGKMLEVNLGSLNSAVSFYECDVYPKVSTTNLTK